MRIHDNTGKIVQNRGGAIGIYGWLEGRGTRLREVSKKAMISHRERIH
jgi:hypothetical protein